MLSTEIISKLKSTLNQDVINVSPVGGGCINETYKVECSNANYFIKLNDTNVYPNMFSCECKGLKLLSENSSFIIPSFVTEMEVENKSILVLEYIEHGTKGKDFNTQLGKNLARLHQTTNEFYGLDYDNYIGALKQSNKQHTDWVEFFVIERLEHQSRKAKNDGKIDSGTLLKFEKLYSKLETIFPKEKPALLHGDLWGGNYMITFNGEPCIYDPAVYFGHREMDIAMTNLFGGFDAEFYKKYNEFYPLEQDWERRIEVCNLYPLLVHVNLFGGGYLHQVQSILNRWV